MINEHVDLVRLGTDAVIEWRATNPGVELDLSGAELSGLKLEDAPLGPVNLHRAVVMESNLARSRLEISSSYSTFHSVVLSRAALGGSSFVGATFRFCELNEIEAADSTFSFCNFYSCIMRGADLRRTDLENSQFDGSIISGVDFAGAHLGSASFAGCNLSNVSGLTSVDLHRACSISIDALSETLVRSGGFFSGEMTEFLTRAGVPSPLLDSLPRLISQDPIQFFSCFVSYGDEDKDLALKLYRDLQQRGLRCWMYQEDAMVGRGVWANIDQAIELHDKVIVVCSEDSLARPGVQREIERALAKEDVLRKSRDEAGDTETDVDVLVPVRVDQAIFSWNHPRRNDVTSKHVGDFREWANAERYEAEFARLLTALDPQSRLGLS